MDAIKKAVNTASDTASETLYGGVPTSHKEQNKSVAKDTNVPLGQRSAVEGSASAAQHTSSATPLSPTQAGPADASKASSGKVDKDEVGHQHTQAGHGL